MERILVLHQQGLGRSVATLTRFCYLIDTIGKKFLRPIAGAEVGGHRIETEKTARRQIVPMTAPEDWPCHLTKLLAHLGLQGKQKLLRGS